MKKNDLGWDTLDGPRYARQHVMVVCKVDEGGLFLLSVLLNKKNYVTRTCDEAIQNTQNTRIIIQALSRTH